MTHPRIRHPELARRVATADEAAALIPPGVNVGMSGFTGAGYPKAVPVALARRIEAANARGERFRTASGPAPPPRPSAGLQTPHLLEEALSWHTRCLRTGHM